MPRIINAYDGNSALGDTLAKLGEAIYGDQAKNEVYRQKAFSSKRENDNIPLLADAAARGDRNEIARLGVMSNKTGQDTADFNRLGVSNHASGVDDPRLALATMGAGGAFTSTAPGQGRDLANRSSIAAGQNATTLESQRIASDRARETQLAIDSRTLTPVIDENGVAHYQPKSQAVGGEAPQTTDSVVANMLRRQAAGQPQAAGAAPQADPFANVNPRILKKAGLELPEQTLVHPATGQVGISRDGGRTLILPDGKTVPSTGFLPVGQDAALTQARDNNVRSTVAQPLVVGDPTKSQAAADAANTSGLGAFVQKHANAELGAIPIMPAILQAANGSPEIAAGTQRAQSQQDIRNNQARSVLLGGPGRQTVQAQKWVNDLIPQGDALSNPATEAAKIPTIVNALKGDHEQIRQLAADPNTLPAERVKLVQQLHQIENTIRMYTEPQQPAAQPQAAAAPVQPAAAAPQGGKPQTVIQNGHTYTLQPDGSYQ